MVTVDGIDYWWCEEHMLDGVKRGMYVQHRPGPEHEEWKKRKDARKANFTRRCKRDREPSPTIAANTTSTSADAGDAPKGNKYDGKKWKLTMNNQL